MSGVWLALLLPGCSDYQIAGEKDVTAPGTDTHSPCPPNYPECNDTDPPPTTDTVDTGPVEPADCTVTVGTAGTVRVVEECEGEGGTYPVDDPWNLSVEFQHSTAGSTVVMPAVGNLTDDNGDGRVNELDVPDIAYTAYSGGDLVAIHGDGSGEIFRLSGYRYDGGVVIADVDDDGEPEVAAITSSGAIRAIDHNGNVEWTSQTFSMLYPVTTVADIDGDGMPEVIADVGVVRGDDGSTVASLSANNFWRAPIAADLDQDGTMEIILADKVFDHNGSLEWSVSGATGTSAFGAVANIDSDDEAEVFFVIGSEMWVYEADGTQIDRINLPGSLSHPGPPCMADFDGDGEVEIAIPNGTAFSVFNVDGSKIWDVTMNDSSGAAGCSGYDVDGDSVYEVLFADQDALRIYDGSTGTVLYENYTHGSVTYFEYPVVADVDNDGSAEIIVSSSSGVQGITVFGHGGDGWNSSGPTWPVHDFGVTNVDPDGSVPTDPEPSWLRYNVFRSRPVVDEPPSADLRVTVRDLCVASCQTGPVKISVQVENQGADDVRAGTPWALYADNAGTYTLVTTGVLDAVPQGESLAGFVIEVMPQDLGTNGFVIAVDDDGTGTGSVTECDEENNLQFWGDAICQ